jgi:hypothetical protein
MCCLVVNYVDTFKAPEPGYIGGLFNNEPFYYYSPAKPKCEYSSLLFRMEIASYQPLAPPQTRSPSTLPTSPAFQRWTSSTGQLGVAGPGPGGLPLLTGCDPARHRHQEMDARILKAVASFGDVKGIVLASELIFHHFSRRNPSLTSCSSLSSGPNGGQGVDAAIAETIKSGIPIVRHVRINVGMIAPSATPSNTSAISSGLINNQKSRIMLQLALATGADPRAVFEDVLRDELYG